MKKIFVSVAVISTLFVSAAHAVELNSNDDFKVTYDLGVSAGKDTNENSYTEGNIGLNLQYTWVEWRNAIFGRFITGEDNVYGLDTSLHAVLEDQSGQTFGYRFFAGPGYRFVTKGENLPFAEAGLVFRIAGLSVGGGAKEFFNKWVDSSQKNETQYFIILGGGGRL